jgi:hypothetical protein
VKIGAVDMDLMIRYWDQEPWGSWRDNFHAALIARAVRQTVTQKPISLDDFMFKRPPEAALDPVEQLRRFSGLPPAGK